MTSVMLSTPGGFVVFKVSEIMLEDLEVGEARVDVLPSDMPAPHSVSEIDWDRLNKNGPVLP